MSVERQSVMASEDLRIEAAGHEWELAVDALPHVICLLDRAGRVIRANRTLERWTGGQAKSVRGLTLHEAMHGTACGPDCPLHAVALLAREAIQRGRELKQEMMDERLGRHVRLRVRPYRTDTGDSIAVATVQDTGDEQEKLRRLTAQHVNVREDERRRVARDLHDALGQSLNVLKLSLQETARRMQEDELRDCADSLQHLAHEVQRIMTEVRRIAMDLRPSTLDDLGLIPTLSWFFRELESRCKGLRVERAIEVTDLEVPEALKVTIYRILQEAVCNTVRHSGALVVRVALRRDAESIYLCIEDDGRGFNGDATRGLGLLNMKERALSSAGTFVIESARGKGTRLTASWRVVAAVCACGAPVVAYYPAAGAPASCSSCESAAGTRRPSKRRQATPSRA